MADKTSRRPLHLDDPYGRSGPGDGFGPSAANDPLAELARLIGQDDPFANLKGEAPRAETPRDHGESAHRAMGAAAGWRPSAVAANDWQQGSRESRDDYDSRRASHARDEYSDDEHDQAQREPYHEHRAGYREHEAEPSYDRHDEHGHAHRSYANEDPHDHHAYADERYERDAHEPPEEEFYDEAPQVQRRNGMLTVAAVVGIAVIGTAGAFGYYALSGGSSPSVQPPVIKADVTPAKVAPPGAAPEGQQGKLIYDRVADKPPGENIVPREEAPLDVKQAAKLMPPRAALSGSGAVSAEQSSAGTMPRPAGGLPPAMALPVPPQAPAANASLNEPKKVKTVTIRPDMTIAPEGARPQQAAAANPAPAVRPPPARPAQSGEATTAAATQPDQSWPPPAEGQPARTPAPRAAPPARGPQLAAAPATGPAVAPAAPTAPAAPSGAFVVQISSQKTEAEAQASFRALQTKYPSVLGSRQPIIRRADLGSRGVYYRAQIGPFATSDQAGEFCGTLKAAGGQCIVQRN